MTKGFASLVVAVVLVIGGITLRAQEEAPQRISVNGDFKPPAKVRHVSPAYPEEAKPAVGTVVLDIVIATDGTVADVEISDSVHELLDQAAIHAVKQWKYVPTRIADEPVEVAMLVTVPFLTAPE